MYTFSGQVQTTNLTCADNKSTYLSSDIVYLERNWVRTPREVGTLLREIETTPLMQEFNTITQATKSTRIGNLPAFTRVARGAGGARSGTKTLGAATFASAALNDPVQHQRTNNEYVAVAASTPRVARSTHFSCVSHRNIPQRRKGMSDADKGYGMLGGVSIHDNTPLRFSRPGLRHY